MNYEIPYHNCDPDQEVPCSRPEHYFDRVRGACKSGLEELLLWGIVQSAFVQNWFRLDNGPMFNHIRPQFPVGQFNIDFLLTFGDSRPWICLGVEADGAAYHTNKQRDAFRDTLIKARGIPVLRFSQTEIQWDPVTCGKMAWRRLLIDRPHADPSLFQQSTFGVLDGHPYC